MATTIGTLKTVFSADTKGLMNGVKKSTTAIKGLSKSLLGVKTMIAGLAGATGFGLLAATVIRTGAQFERTMAVVGGVTRATAAEFEALTNIAREMGATTEWTANQAAEALRFLGMAGFSAEKAIAALPTTLSIATAGAIDLGRAADITTNALTAMQLPIEELSHVGDVFIGTITRSNTTMEKMAESFKFAAPVAKAFGYEIEQLSAMIGVLGNAGVQDSMAGTQLAFAMQKSAKIAEEFNMKGATFVEVLQAMKDRGWEASEIMKAFGMRGGRAALILKDLIPQINQLETSLKNSQGEADALAKTMNDTVIGAWRNFKSAIESLKLDIFERYKEGIQDFLTIMTQSLRELGNSDRWAIVLGESAKFVIGVFGTLAKSILRLMQLYKQLRTWLASSQQKNTESFIAQEGKNIKRLEKQLEELREQYRKGEMTWKEFGTKAARINRVVVQFKKNLGRAKKELGETNDELKGAQQIIDAYDASISDVNSLLDTLTGTVDKQTEAIIWNNKFVEDRTRLLHEQARALEELDRIEASGEGVSVSFEDIGSRYSSSMKTFIEGEERLEKIRKQRLQTSESIIDMIENEGETLSSMSEDIQQIYESIANRITDVMADAFYQIVKDGKISAEEIGKSMGNALMQMGSQIGASSIMQGNWYGAAAGGVMMAGGYGMSNYWNMDDSTRSTLNALSLGGNTALERLGLFGQEHTKADEIEDAMIELTSALQDFGEDLDKQIYMLGTNVGTWSAEFYEYNKQLQDTLNQIAETTQGEAYLGSTDSMISTILGPNTKDDVEAATATFQATMDAWSNYFKQIFIIAKGMVEDIDDFLSNLRVDKTSYMQAREAMIDTWDDLAQGAQEAIDGYEKTVSKIQSLRNKLRNMPAIDYDALRRQATTSGFDREGNWVTEFNKYYYDKLVEQMEASRGTLINSIKNQIQTLTGTLLSEEDLEKFYDVVGAEGETLAKVEEEFANRRSSVYDSMSRYMDQLTGSASDLEQTLWGVEDRFKNWREAIEDTFDPYTQAVELQEELANLEIQRLIAVRETIKKSFTGLQSDINDYRFSRSQEDWGMGEWTNYIQELSDQIDSLDDTSEDYYTNALDLAQKQWDALQAIEDISANQMAALENTASSIDSLLLELRGGSLSAVQSAEFFESQYQTLLAAASGANATAEDVSAFENFIPDFLEFMQGFGPDYNTTVESVISDLEAVQGNIANLIEEMSGEEALLTDIRTILDSKLQEIIDGISLYDPITGEAQSLADSVTTEQLSTSGTGELGTIEVVNNLYIDGNYVGTIVGDQIRDGNPDLIQPLLDLIESTGTATSVL